MAESRHAEVIDMAIVSKKKLDMPVEMEKPKPSLSVSDFSEYKAIKDSDVGDEVTVYIRGKITSKSKDEFGEHMRIEVTDITDEAE